MDQYCTVELTLCFIVNIRFYFTSLFACHCNSVLQGRSSTALTFIIQTDWHESLLHMVKWTINNLFTGFLHTLYVVPLMSFHSIFYRGYKNISTYIKSVQVFHRLTLIFFIFFYFYFQSTQSSFRARYFLSKVTIATEEHLVICSTNGGTNKSTNK